MRLLLILATSLSALGTLFPSSVLAYPKLKITPEVQKAFSDVISYAEKKHYRKDLIFNDDFSKEAFEQYLKLVSPDKELFTEAQVAAMKPLSLMLDDAMKDRNPEVAIELLHRSMGAIEKEIAYKKSQALQLDASRLRASIKAGKALSEKPFTDKEFKDLQWPKNETEQQSKWQEEIDTAIFEYSQQEYTLEETRAALIDSQNNIGKKIDSTTTLDALANLLNSIFKLYDPHTAYLPPASKKEFDTEMSLSFFGIGAKLERKKRYVTISEVLPSGAAAKEGSLKKGDRIVGIQTSETDENKNVIGWTTNDVTNLIRGPQHTPVWVSVIGEHESDMAQPRVIQIIRDKVEIEDESASLHFFQTEYQGRLENIAVLRIPSFYADFQAIRRGDPNPKRVATDVFNLLMEVHKKRVMRLIIDLRNNGGGSLGDVLAMASFFIPEGPLLYTKDSKGTVEAYHDLDGKEVAYMGLLAVLINGKSASASEIFAGIIKDYKRGWIVGTTSYGKGSVQTMENIGDSGAIKYTNLQFFLPSGSSTQMGGVVPHVLLPSPYLYQGKREEELPHALPWSKVVVPELPYQGKADYVAESLFNSAQSRIVKNPDLTFLQRLSVLYRKDNPLRGKALDTKIVELENDRRKAKGLKAITYKQFKKEEDQLAWWYD